MINKDTKIFGSFAAEAGNVGCTYFNEKFESLGINAIYKSFSIKDIKKAIAAARCLNFSGFAVSMPYKIDVLKYVDRLSEEVEAVNAANTIINDNGILTAHNTDYYAAREILSMSRQEAVVLGNGGLAQSVKTALKDLNIPHTVIVRENWHTLTAIRESAVINCTPVADIQIHHSNSFLDLRVTTKIGADFAKRQAQQQLKLYLESIK